MQILEVSVAGVRAAVSTFRRPDTELRFRLFPMMHLGRPEFYRQVEDRLARCDLIVAEGRDQGSSVGLACLWAARATRQRGVRHLVHQNIDYAALGVPVVWPDFPSGNTRPSPRNRWRIAGPLSWLDVVLIGSSQLVLMGLSGRGRLARSIREINDDTRPRLRVLGDLLLHSRDRALARSLTEVRDERADTSQTVAVVYGAAHLPAAARCLARLGFRPVSADWLTVIDFSESSAERTETRPRDR